VRLNSILFNIYGQKVHTLNLNISRPPNHGFGKLGFSDTSYLRPDIWISGYLSLAVLRCPQLSLKLSLVVLSCPYNCPKYVYIYIYKYTYIYIYGKLECSYLPGGLARALPGPCSDLCSPRQGLAHFCSAHGCGNTRYARRTQPGTIPTFVMVFATLGDTP
jgi:hypothetical protein